MDLKTIFVIIHLLGTAAGAGGAFVTDLMFTYSTKDKILDEKEINFISLGSRAVWIGIFIIVLSGIALFALNPERYLASAKFQAKMTIVAILLVNGVIFHKKHLPLLRSQIGKNLLASEEFVKKSAGLYLSGAISITSWISAFALGALHSLPYSYFTIIAVYLLILAIAAISSQFARKMFLRSSLHG